MVRDAQRLRRRFKEHKKDWSRNLPPEKLPKPIPASETRQDVSSYALSRQNVSSAPSRQDISCVPSREQPITKISRRLPSRKNRCQDKESRERECTENAQMIPAPSIVAPTRTRVQRMCSDINTTAEVNSRKVEPRRARKKLLAAKGLFAAVKKNRDEPKIDNGNDHATHSSDNSSCVPSSQSTGSKSTLTATTTGPIPLTPKKAAMIDAVKKNRRDILSSYEQVNNYQTEDVVTSRPEKVAHIWRERLDRPQKINTSRIENVSNLRPRQVTNVPSIARNVLRTQRTSPQRQRPALTQGYALKQSSSFSTRSPLRKSSPLRERLATAKGGGKSRETNVSLRILKPKPTQTTAPTNSNLNSMSLASLLQPKPLQRVQSNLSVHTPRKETRSSTIDIVELSNDDDMDASLVWKMPSWRKEQVRIQERLSQRFPVKISSTSPRERTQSVS